MTPKPTPIQLREALADYAHAAWSGWMDYLFSKAVQNPDGSVTISPTDVARWRRQMETPYAELFHGEQELDRIEADRMLELVREHAP